MERRFVEDMLALVASILIFVTVNSFLMQYGVLPKYNLFVMVFAILLFYFRRRITDKLS